jgi:hypothetical protein
MNQISLDQWKAWAIADAERRGLNALKPLLDGLATSTARLRATNWHQAPDELAGPPADHEDDRGR